MVNLNNAASPPCGACRQMLAEFVLPDAPVLFPAADGPRTMPFSAPSLRLRHETEMSRLAIILLRPDKSSR